jgi:hypothetical protein
MSAFQHLPYYCSPRKTAKAEIRTTDYGLRTTEDGEPKTEDRADQQKDSGFCIIFPSFLPVVP